MQTKSHFQAECRAFESFKEEEGSKREQQNEEGAAGQQARSSRVNGISEKLAKGSAVYLEVQLHGRGVTALLDTGCEHSIIGRKLIPNAPLEPTEKNLYAANGTLHRTVGSTPGEISHTCGDHHHNCSGF